MVQGLPAQKVSTPVHADGDDRAAAAVLDKYQKRINGDHYVVLQVNNDAEFSEIKAHAREMKRELESIAHVDPLTGLPNRRAFFERANAMFAKGSAQLALLMIDIDHFKAVNDAFGHDAGDAVLQTVATTIASSASGSGARSDVP